MIYRDLGSLNKQYEFHCRWAQPRSTFEMLSLCWKYFLGRGWSFRRYTGVGYSSHPRRKLGIAVTERTPATAERVGIGYEGPYDFTSKSRELLWCLQPPELPDHPALSSCGSKAWLFLISPEGVELDVGMTVTDADLRKPLAQRTISLKPIFETGPYHCFWPQAINREYGDFAMALREYETNKELAILFEMSECFPVRAWSERDPDYIDTQNNRLFCFGSKGPNRLVRFLEERRLPSESERNADPYLVYKSEAPPWIVEVPGGTHVLPDDPQAEQRLAEIMELKKQFGFNS